MRCAANVYKAVMQALRRYQQLFGRAAYGEIAFENRRLALTTLILLPLMPSFDSKPTNKSPEDDAMAHTF